MNAQTVPEARSAARRFADRWHDTYPKAVDCLRNNLDELLTCWRYPTLDERKRVRTTNAIERRFRRSAATDQAHGRLPRSNLHGPHPLRRLHPRKLKPGSANPLLPDTNLLTLPAMVSTPESRQRPTSAFRNAPPFWAFWALRSRLRTGRRPPRSAARCARPSARFRSILVYQPPVLGLGFEPGIGGKTAAVGDAILGHVEDVDRNGFGGGPRRPGRRFP